MAQGSIKPRKLKSGRIVWDVVVDFPPDETGQRRQRRRRFANLREAQKGRTALLSEIAAGTVVERSRQTVGGLMGEYLEMAARNNVRPTTLEGYRRTINVHLLPELAGVPIQKLAPAMLEDFYYRKLAAGASRRQMELAHFHLKGALKRAVRLGVLARNVAESVSLPRKEQREEMRTWTEAEAQRFMDAATTSSVGPLWIVLLGSGMRLGEALGLRWQDVDAERRILKVRQAVGLVGNTPIFQPPKTRSGRRDVDVPPAVMEALREHRARQNAQRLRLGPSWADYDLVFPTAIGTPIDAKNLKRDYHPLIALAGVPRIRIHDLRHTYATLALATGADPVAVSRNLGHARVSITMDIYAHALPNKRRDVAERMGAVLFGGSSRALP